MASLSVTRIGDLLAPYLSASDDALLARLSLYLDLLLKWNARTNLTAIRAPEEIVTRHFGESLFAAAHLGQAATLLDYGSGAGFPGLPIALSKPSIKVTLAESQNKKASFLREAVRNLALPVEVWARRVEEMPAGSQFDCVTLRAVDNMDSALQGATQRATKDIVVLTSRASLDGIEWLEGFHQSLVEPMPNSIEGVIAVFRRDR